MRKPVLLVCHISTFFTELFRVGTLLADNQEFEPVFMFKAYPTANDDIAKASSLGIRCLDQFGNPVQPVSQKTVATLKIKKQPTASAHFKEFVRRILFIDFMRSFRQLKEQIVFYQNLFARLKPSLIILAGDQVGIDSPVIIKEGHHAGIRTIVIPSTMSNGLEQAEVYYNDPSRSLSRPLNKLIKLFFPKWAFYHKGKWILRESGERALAMEILKLSPPLPWIFQSGQSDAIAVESPAMRKYYLDGGIPETQLRFVGSLVNDIFFKRIKEKESLLKELYQSLNLPAGKPLILTPLPPDFLYVVGGRPQCDFKKYEDLVEFWLKPLRALTPDYNIVISLHPSVRYEEAIHLESPGIAIARENIVNLIPLCEIFVASVSSTIRWAITCSKPVINYDIYRYQYTDYQGIPGVVSFEEQSEYLSYVHRIANDKEFRAKLIDAQRVTASEWGELDGKTGTRLLELFREMTN